MPESPYDRARRRSDTARVNHQMDKHVDYLNMVQGHFGVKLPFITEALKAHEKYHIDNDLVDTACPQCERK
jgi:hypothetical protein